ncbi:hypothetical protein ACQZV8_14475 [Magnetococcales bacterium HHB-1]
MNRTETVAQGHESPFLHRLKGRFDGLIRMDDLVHLNQFISDHDGWYLFEPGAAIPSETVSGDAACYHLESLIEEILREERGIWTTMVYIQNIDHPEIIKVFHPRRAGCGCGGGSSAIKPWWILSRIKPQAHPSWQNTGCEISIESEKKDKKSWWKRWH